METTRPIRPQYDAELASSLMAAPPRRVNFEVEQLAALQQQIEEFSARLRVGLEAADLVIDDETATSHDGHAVPLHHIRRRGAGPARPCIYYMHGGGMVIGSPWDSVNDFVAWIDDFDVSLVTVDYRLAPLVQAPTLVEDCYAGLLHVHNRAAQLGIDPQSIVVAGMSASGGLAAGTALLARDRGGPRLLGQLLLAPMLDPDSDGDSMNQAPDGPWSRDENREAWDLVLHGVSPEDVGHNAPGRATWLGNMAPALLEVGSAEVFRTEVIDYAERIWRAGGDAELHVWSGGFHGFEAFSHAAVTQAAIESRRSWLARLYGYGPLEAIRG